MSYNQNFTVTVFCLICYLMPAKSAFVCNFTDCQALFKFKAGIISDPEGQLQDWKEANPFCNWTGITCHQSIQNRVIDLELTSMDLQGSISPFLSNLSLLTKLSLQSNSFHGEIPTTLGVLSQLEYLNMSENKLTGAFPASLHGCQRLKFLDLTTNRLSGVIPEELGSMKNLTFLAISQNNLTGVIPAFLSNLTELTRLELAVNYFTGKIPSELGALTRLEILYLHLNFLEGAIPASLCNCTALREISLIENWISGELPAEMGNKLQNLQKLYLMNNNISGRIPVTFSNLSQITLLDVSINYLEGEVPQELGKLKNLEILYLHSNNLVSNSSLGFLTALTNCSFLQKLHLGSCLFAGSLPASIGNLSKDLYYFNLLNNRIRGEIPDSIGNLSGLVTLHLWDNRLDGTIPATFGKLKLLQRLYLGRNKLQGSIPDEMGQMENLGLLDLGNNSITGSIPSSLGNLSQLRYLDLSQNSLSGNIPLKLSQCTLMMQLDLSFNNFQGPLPPEITLLANLHLFLNFSNNNLDGEIPASIGKLVSVQAIDLSVNKFSGMISSSIGSCASLEYLNLSKNMIEGTIPESLKQITYLKVLDLSFNQLTGRVPIWLANASVMQNFNFSYNRLTGEVPSTGLSAENEQPDLQTAVSSGWPASLHLIGKDILRFHAVYWPAMLMSAGLDLPKKVFGHGFLTKDGMKMGKSLGNTLEPNELVHNFGSDAVRYFFLREVEFGSDGDYSEERFINIVNAHLANTIGNLLNRTLGLLKKNCQSTLVVDSAVAAEGNALKDTIEKLVEKARIHYENLSLSSACEAVLEIGNAGNAYMDENAPWTRFKQGGAASEAAAKDLVIILEAMRIVAIALSPVAPSFCWRIYEQLGYSKDHFNTVTWSGTKWGGLKGGQVMAQPKPVFARIENKTELEDEAATKKPVKSKQKKPQAQVAAEA